MALPERVVIYSILLGLLGFTMPITVAYLSGVSLQGSISAYYHTNAGWFFVIFLILLALFMFVFGEYPLKDNISFYEKLISDRGLTTIAGFAAAFMALFPTKADTVNDTQIELLNKWYDFLVSVLGSVDNVRWVHLGFTTILFLIMTIICIWVFPDTDMGRWKYTFIGCATIMVIGWVLIVIDIITKGKYHGLFFWGEFTALYGFSGSWIFNAMTSTTFRRHFGSPLRGLVLITIMLLIVAGIVLLLLNI